MPNLGHLGLNNPAANNAVPASGSFQLSGQMVASIERYFAAEPLTSGIIAVAHRNAGLPSGYIVTADCSLSGRFPAFGFVYGSVVSGAAVDVYYGGEMSGANVSWLPNAPAEVWLGSGGACAATPPTLLGPFSGSVAQPLGFVAVASGGITKLQIDPTFDTASGSVFARDIASGALKAAGAFVQSGNSFGMDGDLGTVDAFNLNVKAGGTKAAVIAYTDKKIMLGNPASGNAVWGIEMRRPDDGAQNMRGMAIYNTSAQGPGGGDQVDMAFGSLDTSGNVHTDIIMRTQCKAASPTSGRSFFSLLAPFDAGQTTVFQYDGTTGLSGAGSILINCATLQQVEEQFRPSSGNIATAGYDKIFSRYVTTSGTTDTTTSGVPTNVTQAQLFHMSDISSGMITQISQRNPGAQLLGGRQSGNFAANAAKIWWHSGNLVYNTLSGNFSPGDTDGFWNSASGTMISIPVSGIYNVAFETRYQGTNTTYQPAFYMYLNGTVFGEPPFAPPRVDATGVDVTATSVREYRLNAGDFLEYKMETSTATGANPTSGGMQLSIRKVWP